MDETEIRKATTSGSLEDRSLATEMLLGWIAEAVLKLHHTSGTSVTLETLDREWFFQFLESRLKGADATPSAGPYHQPGPVEIARNMVDVMKHKTRQLL